MRQPLICLDTETGGLDPRKSAILTCGVATLNLQGQFENPKYWLVIPPEGAEIHPEALKKNKLNLAEHLANPEAKTYEQFREELLEYYSKVCGKYKQKSVKFLGHNIRYDIEMLTYQIFGGAWPRSFPFPSHCVDTLGLASALQAARVDLNKLTLEACTAYYGVENPQAHNALYDAISAGKLYKAILKI